LLKLDPGVRRDDDVGAGMMMLEFAIEFYRSGISRHPGESRDPVSARADMSHAPSMVLSRVRVRCNRHELIAFH